MKRLLTILTVLIVAAGCGDSDEFYTTNDTELKLDIIPFETNKTKYDYSDSDSVSYIDIYIGKVNSQYLSEVENKTDYHIQLNDFLTTSTEEILYFINPIHGDAKKSNITIIADKNTPLIDVIASFSEYSF